MAEYFGVTADDLQRLRNARRIEIEIDALGRPVVGAERRSQLPLGGRLRTDDRRLTSRGGGA